VPATRSFCRCSNFLSSRTFPLTSFQIRSSCELGPASLLFTSDPYGTTLCLFPLCIVQVSVSPSPKSGNVSTFSSSRSPAFPVGSLIDSKIEALTFFGPRGLPLLISTEDTSPSSSPYLMRYAFPFSGLKFSHQVLERGPVPLRRASGHSNIQVP